MNVTGHLRGAQLQKTKASYNATPLNRHDNVVGKCSIPSASVMDSKPVKATLSDSLST